MNENEIITVECEYADCDKVLSISQMVDVSDWPKKEPIWVCQECADKMEDSSGYCSLDCQLGYGCDQSC